MLTDPRPVDLRTEMQITLARARQAARHGGQVAPAQPEPGSSAAPAAEPRATGQAVPFPPSWGRQVVPLSPEPGSAAAQVLAALMGNDTGTDLKGALARLTAHNRAILDTDTGADTLITSLASQLCILEALMQRYTLEAARSTDITYSKVPLQKIAFAAQSAYLRTAMVLAAALDARRTVPSATGSDEA